MVGFNASWSLCGEKNLEDRIDGLLFLPQEWHKKRYLIFFVPWQVSATNHEHLYYYLKRIEIPRLFKFREDLFIFYENFYLSHQITEAGTLQNVKCSFSHNKVSVFHPDTTFLILDLGK